MPSSVRICALRDLHLGSSFANKGDLSPPEDCEPRDLERLMHGREINMDLSRLAGKRGRHDSGIHSNERFSPGRAVAAFLPTFYMES